MIKSSCCNADLYSPINDGWHCSRCGDCYEKEDIEELEVLETIKQLENSIMGNLSDIIEDREVSPIGTYEPIAGTFRAHVIQADVVNTKSGTGKMLKTTHEILEGEHQGRRIFTNFNIVNPNPKAQAIGRGELSALAQACGLPPGIPADSSDLLGREHWIVVKIEPGSGDYGPKSEISQFKSNSAGAKPLKTNPKLEQKPIDEDNIPF